MKFTKSLRKPVLKNIREWLLLLNGEDPTFNIVTNAVLGTMAVETVVSTSFQSGIYVVCL